MAAEVSKGHALDAVAEIPEPNVDNCVAFGDGMNDAEMLAMAGKGLQSWVIYTRKWCKHYQTMKWLVATLMMPLRTTEKHLL